MGFSRQEYWSRVPLHLLNVRTVLGTRSEKQSPQNDRWWMTCVFHPLSKWLLSTACVQSAPLHVSSKLGGASGKDPTCQCGRLKRLRFNPWVRKIPWRRTWQPTPVFLTRQSNGQGSLMGYSPWGHKELDTTEVTSHTRTHWFSQGSYKVGIITLLLWRCPFPMRQFGYRDVKWLFSDHITSLQTPNHPVTTYSAWLLRNSPLGLWLWCPKYGL